MNESTCINRGKRKKERKKERKKKARPFIWKICIKRVVIVCFYICILYE
jgi:hypothetical protein